MPITHANGDLAKQWTTTTGTGTLSMGAVPTGLRSIVAAVGSGKKARFKLSSGDGVNWEIFEGVATAGSPDTVSRDTVFASTNGGAKINLPAGTHTLECTWIAKSANEATPRLLTIGNGLTLSSGTLTVDCMGACDVFAVLPLTANVTGVAPPQNLPERCSLYLEVVQVGGPWTFPQGAWPAGTVLDTAYNLYTDTTKSRFWWTTTDGGTTATLECNGPTAGATGDAYATSHEADTTAHPASNIVNIPAGNIAATTVQAAINELDSEKSSVGHTHTGVYQPADADLSALAGLTSAADKLPYFTGSGTAAVADFPAAARTFLAGATASEQRAIIEAAVPSVVPLTGNTTLTKAAHQGKVLYCTTGPLSITVDTNTDFDAHASCEIRNKTGGVVTFVATATINRIGSKPLTLPANGCAVLMREATVDVYLLTGEMA